MSGWKCNAAGDVDFTNGAMTIVSGTDEVQQNLSQNLRTWLGEWFLDTSLGVPYLQSVLAKGVTVEAIKTHLKAAALDTPGVASLDALDVVLTADRKCTVSLKATSSEGVPLSVAVTV